MNLPEQLYYSADHEWLRLEENNEAVVGITAFAAGELGDIVYVEINGLGRELAAGAVFGTIEAVKTVSDLFLHVAAVLLEVNPALAQTPELVNSDPYGDGWLVRVRLAEKENPAAGLYDAAGYGKLINAG